MSIRVSTALLSLAIAFAMAFSSLLPHGPHSPPHDRKAYPAAESDRYAQLEAEIAEHGHSHDDGEEHERAADYSHGHNPADHSHETPTTPPRSAPVLPAMIRSWMPMPPHAADLGASYRLERPPKPIVIA
jgi:hypothetical protein